MEDIINRGHKGGVGGNYQSDMTARNILQARLLWLTLFRDC